MTTQSDVRYSIQSQSNTPFEVTSIKHSEGLLSRSLHRIATKKRQPSAPTQSAIAALLICEDCEEK